MTCLATWSISPHGWCPRWHSRLCLMLSSSASAYILLHNGAEVTEFAGVAIWRKRWTRYWRSKHFACEIRMALAISCMFEVMQKSDNCCLTKLTVFTFSVYLVCNVTFLSHVKQSDNQKREMKRTTRSNSKIIILSSYSVFPFNTTYTVRIKIVKRRFV